MDDKRLEELITKRQKRKYQVCERLGDGLVGIVSVEYGAQLWARGTRRAYKAHRCAKCLRDIPKNTEILYRPVGNDGNRMKRICCICIDDSGST